MFRVWPKLQFSIFGIFSIVLFHFTFLVASKIKLIHGLSSYFSHLDWREIWHADVSCPSSELIRLLSSSVYFPYFGGILTQWNWSNLRFPTIFLRTEGGNVLKFGMMMSTDHPQHLWDLVMSCWFSLVCYHFDLDKICGFREFSLERIGGMANNLICWCILTTFGTGYILVTVCWFS